MIASKFKLFQTIIVIYWGLCLLFVTTNCGTEVGNGRRTGGPTPPQTQVPTGNTNTATQQDRTDELSSPEANAPTKSVAAESQTVLDSIWALVAADPQFFSPTCLGKNLAADLNQAQRQIEHDIVLTPQGLTNAASVTFVKLSSTRMQQKKDSTVTGYLDFSVSGVLARISDASDLTLSSTRFSCDEGTFSHTTSYTNSFGSSEKSVLIADTEEGTRYKIIWFADSQTTQGSIKQIEVIDSTGASLLIDVVFN